MNFHRLVCVLLLSFSTATLAGKPPKSCQQVYYQPIQTYDQLKQTTAQQERNLKLFKQFSYGIVGLSAAGIAWGLSQWDDDVQAILNANDGIWVSPFTGEKLDINLLLDLRKLNYVQVVKKLTDQGIMVLHIDENSRFNHNERNCRRR